MVVAVKLCLNLCTCMFVIGNQKTKSSTNSNIQLKQRSYTILYAQFAETPSRVSGSKTEVLYCSIRWCLDAWGNVCQKRMGWPHIPASLNERPRRWKRNTALSLQGMDRGSFSLACSGDKQNHLIFKKGLLSRFVTYFSLSLCFGHSIGASMFCPHAMFLLWTC